jgi:hypothetical protein
LNFNLQNPVIVPHPAQVWEEGISIGKLLIDGSFWGSFLNF